MKALFDQMQPSDSDWALAKSIDPERLPAHIAVIMDGNGRWANRRSLPRVAGHKAGIQPVRNAVETCARLGIDFLTLYAFSVENWKRPRHEVETLWRLLRIYMRSELPNLMRNNIRLAAIGRLSALPEMVQDELRDAVSATSGNTGLQVNLAINYGGRAELTDAINRMLKEGLASIDENSVSDYLYTAGQPDPDLLIRTSGELRISNFLLWQISYAEIWVTPKCWPDFDAGTLHDACRAFAARDRRFGGLVNLRGAVG